MTQKKVVEKDKILEGTTIVEGISLASVLPGPITVNVVAFVGYKLGRLGWRVRECYSGIAGLGSFCIFL